MTSDGSDSTFEQFLDFVPDAIIGAAGDGRIVLVNGQAEKMFGYPREGLIGEPLELPATVGDALRRGPAP